ncbi:MAG: hypothetical protein ACRDY7_13060 [Acidimicrobiia bacterium]
MAVVVAPHTGTQFQLSLRGWAAGLGATGAVGMALILVAWAQARDTVEVDEQVSWAAVGIAGASVVGLAAVTGLTLARRAIRRRLDALSSVLGRHLTVALTEAPAGEPTEGGLPVTAANMAHYHRPTCPLVAGKTARSGTEAEHGQAGLRPCAVCEA